MDKKRRRGVLALLVVLSIGNYFRISDTESVSTVCFVSILIMGILTGIFISDLMVWFKSKKNDENKMI